MRNLKWAHVHVEGEGLVLVRFISIVWVILAAVPAAASQEMHPLRVCMEASFWAPHTFTISGRPAGVHVGLLEKAANKTDHQIEIVALPWKRCFKRAWEGSVDAILSSSYSDDRSIFLYFPDDAATALKSPFRVTQADEVVILRSGTSFEWDGALDSLPSPVGSKVGYNITNEMKRQGILVATTTDDKKLFTMLISRRAHSLIAPRGLAEFYAELPNFKGQIKILDRTVSSISYYLAIAKAGRLTARDAKALWQAIAEVREDNESYALIWKRAAEAMNQCLANKAICR